MTAWDRILRKTERLFRGRIGRRSRRSASRTPNLDLERLESLQLMSHVSLRAALLHNRAVHSHVATTMPGMTTTPATGTATVGSAQAMQTQAPKTLTFTASAPPTLTNFGVPAMPPIPAIPPVPLSPAIPLFDPTLGTLIAVTTSSAATETSQIQSENTSTLSGTTITGFVNGTFSLSGLNQPVSGTLSAQTQPFNASTYDGKTDFMGTSGVTFPPLSATSTNAQSFTDATNLAFFTSSAGRTTITPALSASATAGANAPNGNLTTQVATTGQATVTVTYTYIPTMSCPPATGVTRFGVHHQPTQLVVQFGAGTIDPAQAQNPANYTLTAPGRDRILGTADDVIVPIASAVLNTTNNTVTLTTSERINVHYHYKLAVALPCYTTPIVLNFGTKTSLGGFIGHRGQFVPVTNGQIPANF